MIDLSCATDLSGRLLSDTDVLARRAERLRADVAELVEREREVRTRRVQVAEGLRRRLGEPVRSPRARRRSDSPAEDEALGQFNHVRPC